MTTEAIGTPTAIAVNDKWLYKAGGIAAYLVGVVFILALVLYGYAGKMPTTAASWLPYVNAKSGTWSAIIAVNLAGDLLFLLVNVTLYAALRTVNQWLVLFGALWGCVSVVLDEAVTNMNFMSMLTLSQHYATGTAADHAADVAAATYGASILSSWLYTIFTTAFQAIPVLLISIAMLRSPFGKRTAYLGIAAGVFGIIGVTGFALAALLNTVLQAVWAILVGRSLYFRYGSQSQAAPAEILEPESESAAAITL